MQCNCIRQSRSSSPTSGERPHKTIRIPTTLRGTLNGMAHGGVSQMDPYDSNQGPSNRIQQRTSLLKRSKEQMSDHGDHTLPQQHHIQLQQLPDPRLLKQNTSHQHTRQPTQARHDSPQIHTLVHMSMLQQTQRSLFSHMPLPSPRPKTHTQIHTRSHKSSN